MNKYVIFIGVLILFTSCNLKFDKNKWMIKEDIGYKYRNDMLDDLIKNHKIKGLRYNELADLIGEPDKNMVGDSECIYYPIIDKYGFDIDPVYSKTLEIWLNKDSIVTKFEVFEHKK
jgi:hypothetical protein